MPKKGFIPNKLRLWIEARNRYHLSHIQIQMARELGMNPKSFRGMANNKQEKWKLPLKEYIEHLYEKRFKKKSPEDTRSLENQAKDEMKKRASRKAAKLLRQNESST